MPLVEELNVSLKDFLPVARSHLITHDGLPVALVSDQLYQKLKDYAGKNHLPIRSALERLREEVNAATAPSAAAQRGRDREMAAVFWDALDDG